jgi:translation initiation factor 4G
MNTGGSPAPTHSIPHQSQGTPSVPIAVPNNPRVASPAQSPSPIPPSGASGGRPPSGLQSQGNGLSFGSLEMGDVSGFFFFFLPLDVFFFVLIIFFFKFF